MNESSERRSAARSIREALRNSSGKTEPEWGELKMIGARQCAGSTISNGGDSSPSNWVILGRRPLNVRFPFGPIDHATDSAGRAGLCKDVLSVIVIILPSEKSRRTTGRCRKRLKSAALIDLGTISYRNSIARRHQEAVTFHPKFTLCRA